MLSSWHCAASLLVGNIWDSSCFHLVFIHLNQKYTYDKQFKPKVDFKVHSVLHFSFFV